MSAVRAIRGATSVPRDSRELIHERTAELVAAVMERNGLVPDDLISVIFTSTEDLVSAFPAAGAREMGLGAVPLICAREIPVPGALPSCVRLMAHANMPVDRPVRHVYLHEAVALRADLAQ
ncbi:MAG TPA: chorismate mutase [Miltoncostaeaceae bacterium]|nr:chorismate mutase [Miltoncostaeaceae bacterium]